MTRKSSSIATHENRTWLAKLFSRLFFAGGWQRKHHTVITCFYSGSELLIYQDSELTC